MRKERAKQSQDLFILRMYETWESESIPPRTPKMENGKRLRQPPIRFQATDERGNNAQNGKDEGEGMQQEWKGKIRNRKVEYALVERGRYRVGAQNSHTTGIPPIEAEIPKKDAKTFFFASTDLRSSRIPFLEGCACMGGTVLGVIQRRNG